MPRAVCGVLALLLIEWLVMLAALIVAKRAA